MRLYLFLTFWLCSFNAFAQNLFSRQLKAIVNDTANGFKNVRGKFDKQTRLYDPKFIIDSTENGKVFNVRTRSYYTFQITGSSFEDSSLASRVLINWKNKIGTVLGPLFSVAPENAPFGVKKFFDRGYVFTHGKLTISVEQMNRLVDNKKVHYVRVFIMHKPGI